jgi:prepilin-type N-terminal cleavage/methylation domain-containing protein
MKIPFLHRKKAFTLVEILVVIAIIAILAGVILSAIGSALRYAKRTKANAMCVQLQTAVQGFYIEYGVYPVQTADATGVDTYYSGNSDTTRWLGLMEALCGNINPLTGAAIAPASETVSSNTRGIKYISPTRGDMDANGVLANPFGTGGTSTNFFMAIDTDYDNVVGDSGTASGKLPNFTGNTNINSVAAVTGVPVGVAVWCSCDQQLFGSGKASNPNFWAHTY